MEIQTVIDELNTLESRAGSAGQLENAKLIHLFKQVVAKIADGGPEIRVNAEVDPRTLGYALALLQYFQPQLAEYGRLAYKPACGRFPGTLKLRRTANAS